MLGLKSPSRAAARAVGIGGDFRRNPSGKTCAPGEWTCAPGYRRVRAAIRFNWHSLPA